MPAVLAMLAIPLSAAGQIPAAAEGPIGPPPPALPQTLSRDDQGRATVRAVRLSAPMRTDGRLDEAIYQDVHPASGFIQMEPDGGQPATERTEVWVFYDDENVYVSFRAWESQPDRMITNEMRRDSGNIRQGDSVEFAFDTFRDRRNAILFEANALGARTDIQSTNERQMNVDWNPVWTLSAGRFEGGWTIEAALPFKSIRYGPGSTQDWGFQARRSNKWKNEISYLTKLPPALGLGRADFSASLYANLVGLEAPPLSRNLEIKPYERLRYTDKFESDDPEMQGEMKVTVTFRDVPGGTEVRITQEGLPKVIPTEGAMLGWSQSLENLARLVEL